jgi:hypothetical protein
MWTSLTSKNSPLSSKCKARIAHTIVVLTCSRRKWNQWMGMTSFIRVPHSLPSSSLLEDSSHMCWISTTLLVKKTVLLDLGLMIEYDRKWTSLAKWIDCDKTYPISIINYIVSPCIMQPRVDRLRPKLEASDLSSLWLNFSIFSHRLDKGVTCQRCNQSCQILVRI